LGKSLQELRVSDEPLRYSGNIKTARGRLAAFISTRTAKVRRLLTGEGLTGWETLEWHELNDQERQDFDKVLEEYRQLIDDVLREWKSHGARQQDVLSDYDQIATGQLSWPVSARRSRRGAPTKSLKERSDVARARLFLALTNRLARGMSLKIEITAGGGYESGEDRIRPRLEGLGYSSREITAITQASTLKEVALGLLARRLGFSRPRLPTLRASVHRGMKLVEAAGGWDALP
jgi:hypothetical protein